MGRQKNSEEKIIEEFERVTGSKNVTLDVRSYPNRNEFFPRESEVFQFIFDGDIPYGQHVLGYSPDSRPLGGKTFRTIFSAWDSPYKERVPGNLWMSEYEGAFRDLAEKCKRNSEKIGS